MDSSIKPVLFILLIILSLYLDPSKIPCINSSLPLNPTLILFQFFPSSQPNSDPVSILPFISTQLLSCFNFSIPDPVTILPFLSTKSRSYFNSSITLNPTQILHKISKYLTYRINLNHNFFEFNNKCCMFS